MSGHHQGYFGSGFPLTSDESVSLEGYQPPQLSMITTNVPRLPLPNALGMGNDPRSAFTTSPTRNVAASAYHTSRPGSSSEKLPPVSHLLPPVSPATSAYSHSHGYSPIGRSAYGNASYDASPQYQSSYHTAPSPIAPPYGASMGSMHAPRRSVSDNWGYPSDAQNSYTLPSPHSSDTSPSSATPTDSGHGPALVQLVGERVVPGEGPCYIYDDGSYVRKIIDGEAVNAQWGITKAGKPRKRLAIACITCREKKIKCDPAVPKCVQCDKTGRDCRFQTA